MGFFKSLIEKIFGKRPNRTGIMEPLLPPSQKNKNPIQYSFNNLTNIKPKESEAWKSMYN